MPFVKKPQVFGAKINELTLGTGDKAVALGGQNVFSLCSFDGPLANPPRIGIDVSDDPAQPCESLRVFYAGCETLADRAARAAALEQVDFVCIRFDLADPGGANKSVAECVAEARAVAEAVDKPLVVAGCQNVGKDAELFAGVSEALRGRNILILSAREENYKAVAAAGLASGQKVAAESSVDINLAKQLNVLMAQAGMDSRSVVMDVGSAAAGYGFEYVASTLERVKAAALGQNDAALQMPIITPVGVETWSVKESTASEDENIGWGGTDERGIDMEVETAAACLAYGSDAVILRHPESIRAIAQLIAALM